MTAQDRPAGGDSVVLLARASPDAPFGFVRLDTRGRAIARGEHARAGDVHGARAVLVLSAAEAQIKRLEIAARSEAQARAAAPFLFEGRLGESAEGAHYAVGAAQNETGDRLVAAMSAARLNAWIDACRALGADPERVYLDATIWPAPDGAVEIVEHDDAAMVAGGKLGGFAIEAGLAPAIAARWLEPLRNEISAINLCVRDGDAWSRALGPNAAPVERGAVDDFALVLARSARAAPAHAPNLRQGALARVTSQRQWRLWRFAAVLALLALLLQVGSLIAAGWQDARAARETLAQAARDLSEARPDVGRVVNVRAQARALVNAIDQAGNHPVLAINAALIEVLETQPLVRLDEVRHAAPGRSVQLRLSSTDAAALEAAARALRAGGLTVEARAVTQADGRYQSELSAESP